METAEKYDVVPGEIMVKKERYTIGMFVSGIVDSFTTQLCRGVMRAAEEADLDVVVLPGKYLFRDLSGTPEYQFEYQYGTVFSHIQKNNVDGLIIAAGCIGCMTTEEKMRQFLKNYSDIPSVLVASRMDGYTCISYDNQNAVCEGLEYLIEKAGCKYICIIDGPDGNTDSQERKAAYLKTLRKYGLPYQAKQCAHGDLADSQATRQAMAALILDNPRMDAVFCVNDDMAIAAYEVLKKQGLEPGRDVKVLGYDNIQRSLTMDPPLSTIAADPVLLGMKAVEYIQKKMMDEPVENVTLPSRFVLRESFGTMDEIRQGKTLGGLKHLIEDFNTVFYRYINGRKQEEAEETCALFSEFVRTLLTPEDEFQDFFNTKQKVLKQLDDFILTDAMSYMDLDELLYYLDRQRAEALHVRGATLEAEAALEELWNEIYRRLILAVDKRFGDMSHLQGVMKGEMKNFVRETMNFRNGSSKSYAAFLNYLSWLQIRNAYLYRFERTVRLKDGYPFPVQDMYYMKAVCKNGVVRTIPEFRQLVYQEDLFDNREMGKERRCMVLLPLFFGEENYGLLLCDLTEGLFVEGEFVVSQLGAAAHMLHILQMNEKIQEELKKHLEVTQRENIALDKLSRYDGLTGLMNRRGFLETAESRLEECRQEGKDFLIAYMDMNYLKQVNDRFGHEEGDFSLCEMGKILQSVMPEHAVLGRIGGDEYACACAVENAQITETQLPQKLKKVFEQFNRESDKPYLLSASAGIYVVKTEEEKTLAQALAAADERLYQAKQQKEPKWLKAEDV